MKYIFGVSASCRACSIVDADACYVGGSSGDGAGDGTDGELQERESLEVKGNEATRSKTPMPMPMPTLLRLAYGRASPFRFGSALHELPGLHPSGADHLEDRASPKTSRSLESTPSTCTGFMISRFHDSTISTQHFSKLDRSQRQQYLLRFLKTHLHFCML